jgi:hypothetical protein
MTASFEVDGGTGEGDEVSAAAVARHLECTGSLDQLHDLVKVSSHPGSGTTRERVGGGRRRTEEKDERMFEEHQHNDSKR